MTYSEKLKLAAEMRAGTALETGIPDVSFAMIRKTRLSPLLPGGAKRSMEPEPLPPGPDLSHLNPTPHGRAGTTVKPGQKGKAK